MNLKSVSLIFAAILFACAPALAQQKKQQKLAPKQPQPSQFIPDPVMPEKPKKCVEFDEMAARVEAVTTIEEITADEFATAAAQPTVIIRNPGQVFDLGDAEYISQEGDGKTTYTKITTHKDKKTEFLKWYGANNRVKMMTTGMSCLTASNASDMAVKVTEVILAISQADTISEDGFRDTMGAVHRQNLIRAKNKFTTLLPLQTFQTFGSQRET